MHDFNIRIARPITFMFSEEVHNTNVRIKKKSSEISELFLYRIKKD
jgi:hypothetical protein